MPLLSLPLLHIFSSSCPFFRFFLSSRSRATFPIITNRVCKHNMESTQELIDTYHQGSLRPETLPMERKMSPEKTGTPFRSSYRRGSSVSPLKKTRNDYQDHIFRMRGKERGSVSVSGSPLRPLNRDLRADLTVYDAFDEPSPFRDSGADVFSKISRDGSSVDREIDDFIAREAHFLDLQTEYVLRDTHKVIRSIPESIVASAEGEKYYAMLTASINKLTREMDNLRHENNLLRDRDYTNDYRIRELEARVSHLQMENGRLASQRVTEVADSAAKRANELLRAKLLKYKRLNDECRKWHGDKSYRLEGLIEQLEEALKNEKQQSNQQDHGNGQQKTQDKGQDDQVNLESVQIPSPQLEPDGSLYEKFESAAKNALAPSLAGSNDMLAALNMNNRLYERLLAFLDQQVSAAPHHECNENVPPSQCSACTNPPATTNPGHDTMQLMGEYKWTLG